MSKDLLDIMENIRNKKERRLGIKKTSSKEKQGVAEIKNFLTELKKKITRTKDIHISSDYYKPSNMHCRRAMYYSRYNSVIAKAGVIDTIKNYQLVGMAHTGTARHEFIQEKLSKSLANWANVDVAKYVKNMGLVHLEVVQKIGYETKLLDKEHNVSFLVDGILQNKKTKDYVLFEFKNVISFKFSPSRKTPLDEHLRQIHTYCMELDLDRAFVLYENRNTCELSLTEAKVTVDEKKEIIKLLEDTERHVEAGVLPELEASKKCAYCNYATICGINWNKVDAVTDTDITRIYDLASLTNSTSQDMELDCAELYDSEDEAEEL